jgi:diguanylate cyclase (GGDEF)-like protein
MVFRDIKDLKAKIKVLYHIFDVVRVVNPFNKEIVCVLQGEKEAELHKCYNFWGKDKECANCIAMKASNENHSISKIEGNNKGFFVATSLPIQMAKQNLVLELIQNVTESLSFEHGDISKDSQEIVKLTKHITHLITTDELTGLYNRRFINDNLTKLLYEAHTYQHSLSVIYLDIDFFKEINDTYGHDAGDQVLKELSLILRDNMNTDGGWVARYGGDEFIICLPSINKKAAKRIAEKIRQAVSEKTFIIDGQVIHITCSFGVNSVYPYERLISSKEFLRVADQKLYRAKSSGRNQVV